MQGLRKSAALGFGVIEDCVWGFWCEGFDVGGCEQMVWRASSVWGGVLVCGHGGCV